MAQSLADECTPLKIAYDACFNAWFEGYLQPAVDITPEGRAEYTKAKAAEYEEKCGKIWCNYKACVQVCLFSLVYNTIMLVSDFKSRKL